MNRVLFLVGLILTISCSQEDQFSIAQIDRNSDAVDFVYQERDPSLPAEPNRLAALPRKTATVGMLGLSDYMGRAYLNRTSIMGDPENFTIPVIDINKLKTQFPNALTPKYPMRSSHYSFAYASDKSYETESHSSEKVTQGFKLNLGLFSLGRKKTIERIFSSSYSENSSDAAGELSIEILDALYELQTSDFANKQIAGECLDNYFIEQIYNQTIDSFLESYGPFVAMRYYTGGRALCLYYGSKYSVTSEWAREEGLKQDIDASFSFRKTSAGGNLSVGRTNGSSEKTGNHFENVYIHVQTIGGTKDTRVNTGARNLDDFHLDLSNWLKSMDDRNNHTVIDIADKGLHPISDFLLEQNFQKRIQETHLGKMTSSRQQAPYIRIEHTGYMQQDVNMGNVIWPGGYTSPGGVVLPGDRVVGTLPAKKWVAVLYTRHHDRIILGNSVENKDSLTLAAAKSPYYKLRITVTSKKPNHPNCVTISLKDLNESRMYKYINSSTNMVYLYDPVAKCAFAFPNDDYTIDVYGIRAWFESMPSQKLSMTSLEKDYTVVGL